MLTDKLDLAAIDMTTRDQLAEEKTKYRSLHIQTYEPLEIGDRMWRHHHKTKKWHMQATVLHSRAGGSYFIQADNDKEYIGWRHFLPLVNETPKTDIKADKVRRLTLITMPQTSKYSETKIVWSIRSICTEEMSEKLVLTGRKSREKGSCQRGPGLKRERSLLKKKCVTKIVWSIRCNQDSLVN